MLTLTTAGESHGYGVLALLEGFPHGFPLDAALIDAELARRQLGYGRGGRMRIETDTVELLAGLRHGRTIGSPLMLLVKNRDTTIDRMPAVSAPRPGHVDLAGALKYGLTDARDCLERASARETAARVAAGAICQALLNRFGVRTVGYVTGIGGVQAQAGRIPASLPALVLARDASPVLTPDPVASEAMCAAIDTAKAAGDSLGGRFTIVAEGVPPGLGAHWQWDRKLDAHIGAAMLSIPAIKAVAIGDAARAGNLRGSEFHDAIQRTDPPPASGSPFVRPTNRAGGIEGGISNGAPIVVHATMKPIPTLRVPLSSVDLVTGATVKARKERTDCCAVPAASVVGQNVLAFVLLRALLEKFGGDTVDDVAASIANYQRRLAERFGRLQGG